MTEEVNPQTSEASTLEQSAVVTHIEEVVGGKIDPKDAVVSCDCINPKIQKLMIELIDEKLKPWKKLNGAKFDMSGIVEPLEALRKKIAECDFTKGAPEDKKKRALSSYQQFMSVCMKGGDKGMRHCVDEWKVEKTKTGGSS